MPRIMPAYRVLAYVVGVFVIAVVGGWIVKFFTEDGSSLHELGEVTAGVSPIHGVLYMVLLVMMAVISREAGWSVGFTLTTMLMATIPFVSFWAEHRATAHTRALVGEPARTA